VIGSLRDPVRDEYLVALFTGVLAGTLIWSPRTGFSMSLNVAMAALGR